MTYKEVYQVISAIPLGDGAIPAAYYQFPEDDPNNPAPPPPFLVYYYSGSDDLTADNTNYQRIRPLTIELYTDNKEFTIEDAVETALNAAGIAYSRTEVYVETEHLYMVTYTSDIIITEELEDNGE